MTTISDNKGTGVQRVKGFSRRRFLLSGLVASNVCLGLSAIRGARDLSEARQIRDEINTGREKRLEEIGRYMLFWQGQDGVPSLSTETGDFYFWFTMHGTEGKPAEEKYQLGVEKVRKIIDAKPNLIYVPEKIHRLKPNDNLRKLIHNGLYYYPLLLVSCILSSEASQYLLNQNTPLLLLDVFEREALYSSDGSTCPVEEGATIWRWPLLSLMWAAISAGLYAAPFKRRNFLAALALLAGGAESYFGSSNPQLIEALCIKESAEKEDLYLVDFRNALIAFKLLNFARRYRELTGEKPAFLLTFGQAHRKLSDNIAAGEEYNLRVLGEIGKRLNLTLAKMERETAMGFFYKPEPVKGSAKVEIEELTFEDLYQVL